MGVATGCGCKDVSSFPHTTYPNSSCIFSFLQQHPYFLFIFLEQEERTRRRRMPNHDFLPRAWCVRKLHYYSDVMHSFDWKSVVEHDGGVLNE